MDIVIFLVVGMIIGALWRARRQSPPPVAKPDVSYPRVTVGLQLESPPKDA